MSTPQYIPPEFQDELDLPEPGINQAALAKAKAGLAKEKAAGHKNTLNIDAANKRIKNLQTQLKNKKLSPRDRAMLIMRVAEDKRLITSQTKLRNASIGRQRDLQNKVYEAGGEYDKLLEGGNRDAFLALKSLFGQYGLGSLAGKIYDYVKQGYGADTISLLLQDTKEYKERFGGNEARIKAGLPVLAPAEYLATESAYRQILSSAGLPKGFYDNPADFRNWIANDVSPTEIKSRVDMAVEATSQANPAYKQALKQMYGINETDLTAYFLDRKKAEPLLKKQAAAAAIGAAAIQRGFAPSIYAEAFATEGITAEQAQQGYGSIAETYEPLRAIAARYGTSWTQGEAERDVFEPGLQPGKQSFAGESVTQKRKRLASQERAAFSGGRGSSTQGLSAGYSQT